MALLGNAQQGLALRITETGAEQVTGKLNRVAGAADRVARSGGGGGFSRLTSGLSRVRGMATGLLGVFGRLGGMLGIGGGLAFAGLIGETLSVERNLRRIQYQGNLGADAMKRMRDTMNQVAGATGKGRAEIVAAIDAANDMGLPMEQAREHMQQMALWADLLGVNTDLASGAIGSLFKATGGKFEIPQLMSMMDAAAKNGGMDEGTMLQLVRQVAPQLEGVESLTDLTTFFQSIAGIGEEFAADPRMLKGAFKGMNRLMGDPKQMAAMNKVGVEGKNAAELFLSMARILEADEHALDRANLPDEVVMIARAMVGNSDRINDMGKAVSTASGQAAEFGRRVSEHAKDPEVAWAGTMERLKIAMDPLINGVLNWVVSNREQIIGAFQTLIDKVKSVAEWLADWWPAALAAALAGKAIPVLGAIGGAAGGGAGAAGVATGALAVTAGAGIVDLVSETISAAGEGRLPQSGIVKMLEDRIFNPERARRAAAEQAGANAVNEAMRAEQEARIAHSQRIMGAQIAMRPEGQAVQQAGAAGLLEVLRGLGVVGRTSVDVRVRAGQGVEVEAEQRTDGRTASALTVEPAGS